MKVISKIFSSDLSKSISSGYVLFFLNNVVAIFLTPYMLKFVSKEEYGLYILCVDFLSWVGFLEFGTSKVLESKAGHLLANNDQLGLNKSFNSALFFQILIGIIIIPFFYFGVDLGLSNAHRPDFSFVILVFSISAGLSVIKNLFSAVIIAGRKVHLDNSIQIFINLLNYLLVLILTPFIGVMGLAIITIVVTLISLVKLSSRLKQLFPFINISLKNFDRVELRKLLSNGIFFSLASIATVLISKIDSFLLGKYMGLEIVASYYISIKIFILLQKFIQILYNNYRPYISNFYGKNDYKSIQFFYNTSSWFLYGVTTVFMSFAFFLNETFVFLWVGSDYLMGRSFIILFGLYILLDLYTLPSRVVLVSSLFKIPIQSFYKILEGIFRIIIVFLFLHKLQQDVLPLSSVVSGIIFGNIFFFYQIRRYFQTNGCEDSFPFQYISLVNCLLVLGLLFFKLFYLIPIVLLIMGIAILIYSFKYEFNNLRLLRSNLAS